MKKEPNRYRALYQKELPEQTALIQVWQDVED